jgi:hypothetical protein
VIRAGERWANQADLRVSQRMPAFCYKNLGLKGDFRRAEASLPQPAGDHKCLVGAEIGGLVLNVPLSSVICR